MFLEWQASVLSLLGRLYPPEHTTIRRFDEICRTRGTPHSAFKGARAYFQSAKSDFEGGYLFDVRNLVHAEVFSDELDLGAHYLKNNGKTAAAVVAGVVLETALRKLVTDNALSGSMLNGMNQSLRDANVYSQIVWRQIQAWADIRNAAAHGSPDDFEDKDVTRMIDGIRDFVANHIS
ncbi:hypothetical protein Rcae01_06069 [Novipirellula caenicola]|uniref:DUF4145 domain-containing protein n=2 Tax=Novipirellula caenicola TaxID=1536901 RepID=A0ABP9W219_9BACT